MLETSSKFRAPSHLQNQDASGTHRSRLHMHFSLTDGSHGLSPVLSADHTTWRSFSKSHNLWPEWASFWFSSHSTQCHLKEGIGRWDCLCLVMTAKILFENFKLPHKSQPFIIRRETYYSYLKYVVGCKILLKYRLESTKKKTPLMLFY